MLYGSDVEFISYIYTKNVGGSDESDKDFSIM